jgi:hypothetical protein
MLFFCLSLSYFLGFSLLHFLIDLLSKFLEENFQVNIVSRERNQQLVSQKLNLIADYRHLLREHLIYCSHLNLDLIPYLMVQSLQFLILLVNLEFCQFIKLLNHIFSLILNSNEVIVSKAELRIDLFFEN